MRDEHSASWRLNGRVEQLRVGQLAADAGQLAERGVGAREREDELAAVGQLGGSGAGTKAAYPSGQLDDLAGLGGVELGRVHDSTFALSDTVKRQLKAYRVIVTNR